MIPEAQKAEQAAEEFAAAPRLSPKRIGTDLSEEQVTRRRRQGEQASQSLLLERLRLAESSDQENTESSGPEKTSSSTASDHESQPSATDLEINQVNQRDTCREGILDPEETSNTPLPPKLTFAKPKACAEGVLQAEDAEPQASMAQASPETSQGTRMETGLAKDKDKKVKKDEDKQKSRKDEKKDKKKVKKGYKAKREQSED